MKNSFGVTLAILGGAVLVVGLLLGVFYFTTNPANAFEAGLDPLSDHERVALDTALAAIPPGAATVRCGFAGCLPLSSDLDKAFLKRGWALTRDATPMTEVDRPHGSFARVTQTAIRVEACGDASKAIRDLVTWATARIVWTVEDGPCSVGQPQIRITVGAP